jgi:ketosteroid isomerase-like protein
MTATGNDRKTIRRFAWHEGIVTLSYLGRNRVNLDDWIERYRTAWEEADADVVGELFTEDATYLSSPFGQAHRGREEIREYWRRATGSQSRVRVEMGQPVVDGRRVVVEWWAQMDDDGTPLTLPGALVRHFDAEGRCRALREYYNLEVGRRIPPPEGWGS